MTGGASIRLSLFWKNAEAFSRGVQIEDSRRVRVSTRFFAYAQNDRVEGAE